MTNDAGVSSTSSSARPCKLSDDARPDVPRRTSSIISSKHIRQRSNKKDLLQLHRQSCQLFSSLNGTVAQCRDSSVTDLSALSFSSGRGACPYRQSRATTHTASTFSSFFASASSVDESPLAYTLARKHTSLPYTEDQRMSQSASLVRSSYQSSFLSAFPEPPTTCPPPLPSAIGHQRGKSSYRIFPQQPPSPPLSTIPLSRPPITTTDSYSSHPNIEQEMCNNDPSRIEPISWTSPATRQAEYAKIDRAQYTRRKLLRMFVPRRLCGSLGGERGEFFDEKTNDTRSVRRFRLDKEAIDNVKTAREEHESEKTTDSDMTSSTSDLLDEKSGNMTHNARNGGADKKMKKNVRCL